MCCIKCSRGRREVVLRAELSTYVGTSTRYGQRRPTTARIIPVKEDLVRATLVKSDQGPVPGTTVEVLKRVVVADFPTGTNAYHQVAQRPDDWNHHAVGDERLLD